MRISAILAGVQVEILGTGKGLSDLKKRILGLVQNPDKEVDNSIVAAISYEIAIAANSVGGEQTSQHIAILIAMYLNGLQGVVCPGDKEKIEDLELRPRCKEALKYGELHIETVGELTTKSFADISGLRSIGPRNLLEIRKALAKRQRHLKNDEKWYNDNKPQ